MKLTDQLYWAGISLLTAGLMAGATSAQSPAGPSVSKAKLFAPGVRIDWTNRRVEVDAVVVLRQGALELIACSPQTREHESIFAVEARLLNVFQAMGLIGLEPGSPLHYDEKNQRWIEPMGHALGISVRFEKDDRRVDWPIERWLLRTDTDKVPDQLPWIFTGSARTEGGRLAADDEGTLICVVDFTSALIAVGDRHTADDQQLWLRANTKVIPPIGTKCTLIITERLILPLHLIVDSDGTLVLGTRVLSVEQVVSTVQSLERHSLPSVSSTAVSDVTQDVKPRGLKPAAQKTEKTVVPVPTDAKPVIVLKPKNAEAVPSIPKIVSLLTAAGLAKSRIHIESVSFVPVTK